MPAAAPSPNWGGSGVEWLWDFEAPRSVGEKRLKCEHARETVFASRPGLLPLVSSPKLPLAPGSPTPATGTYFFPHLYFRVSPKIKNTEIKGKKEKLFTGVREAAELGWERGEWEKQLGNHYLLVKTCLG